MNGVDCWNAGTKCLSLKPGQKQTDEQLTAIINTGKTPMPAYKDKLTGDQITQLVAYVRTLAKK